MHIVLGLILAQALSTSPTPAPIFRAGTGETRTLADVARERKLGIAGVKGGTLSVTGASGTTQGTKPPIDLAGNPAASVEKEASGAQAQQVRAIRDAAWTQRNIHYHEGIKQDARNEWDNATENCRKTPGCIPVYRENATIDGVKPLETGSEWIQRMRQENGASAEAPPQRGTNTIEKLTK